jgi:hypothetical protein
MKIQWKIAFVFIILLLTFPFAFDMLTVSTLTWSDIQRYGGLKVGQPLDTEKGYFLPIICNVSGNDSITLRPTSLNSSNVCKRTRVTINKNNIFICVKVSGPYFDDETCNCKAIRLGQLNQGHYKVFYETGEFIDEFDL